MSSSPAPTTPEDQLRWLVDRAQLHDLLVEYARTVDDRDFAGWQDLYTEDGRFVLPFGSVPKPRLAEFAAAILTPYPMTHHLQSNRAMEIDGDDARIRAYLQSIHVGDPENLYEHADVGGWFKIICRREEGTWKLVEVRAEFVWLAGQEFAPPPDFDLDPLPEDA